MNLMSVPRTMTRLTVARRTSLSLLTTCHIATLGCWGTWWWSSWWEQRFYGMVSDCNGSHMVQVKVIQAWYLIWLVGWKVMMTPSWIPRLAGKWGGWVQWEGWRGRSRWRRGWCRAGTTWCTSGPVAVRRAGRIFVKAFLTMLTQSQWGGLKNFCQSIFNRVNKELYIWIVNNWRVWCEME